MPVMKPDLPIRVHAATPCFAPGKGRKVHRWQRTMIAKAIEEKKVRLAEIHSAVASVPYTIVNLLETEHRFPKSMLRVIQEPSQPGVFTLCLSFTNNHVVPVQIHVLRPAAEDHKLLLRLRGDISAYPFPNKMQEFAAYIMERVLSHLKTAESLDQLGI